MTKVGFIGLGVQGKYLAINLADAGYDLMVYDLRRDLLNELVTHNAKIASSNADIGAHAEIIGVCVLDDRQVKEVVLGPRGLLETAKPGTIIAIHSTVDPQTIGDVARAAQARGVEIVDAPVSGSEPGARAKSMLYMVGGSKEAFERCQPVFSTSAKTILHTGALGTGIRSKLAHQLVTCVNMLAAYEGFLMGNAAGLPPEILTEVLRTGAGQSRLTDRWATLKLGPHAQEVFFKDLRLCLKFAHDLKIPVPGAALAQQLLDRIVP
jgi:3-hydroxyisobutyrate dehydrogenase-like beta-hydroxyacid dehydrogenase